MIPHEVEEATAAAVAPADQGRFTNYRRVLGIAPYRRLFVGEGLSALGDGCGYVAVAWMAIQLSSVSSRPYAVGLSLAAFAIPGAVVGLVVAGRLGTLQPRLLLVADGTLRLVLLACIPLLYGLRLLTLWAFVLILAVSSLLTSAGRGAFVSAVATHVPGKHRFSANTLISSTQMIALGLVGPAVGGVLIVVVGAPAVIGIDAASFAALLWAGLRLPKAPAPVDGEAPRRVTLRELLRRPTIVWLLALTVIFYGLYGPFETALPIFVTSNLHGGAKLFGFMWAAFGLGAVAGGVLAGLLKEIRRVEPFALAVVAGWGAAVLVVGATAIPAVAAVGMLAGGAVYTPYPAVTTTTLQNELAVSELAAGAAGWAALVSVVPQSTIALGGPLVAAIGARATILWSGYTTIGLAVLVTAARMRTAARRTPVPRAD